MWAAELLRHRERIAQARPRLQVVQLGGALGTMEFWGPAALDLLDSFAARLELGVPETPWITARDRVAEFATLLALVTATLAKIGNEIFELQRPELGELSEPFTQGQVGSITMPHKRNPELAEHLDTLGRVVRANAGLAVEGMTALHERDGRGWKAEWLILPERASLLTGAALGFAARLLEGLQVHAGRMRANLDAQRGYVLSEPVLRLLTERIGKHAAHDAVYQATMAGLDAGVDLATAVRDAGLVGPGLLTEDELAAALEPAHALGAATAFVDRILARGSGGAQRGRPSGAAPSFLTDEAGAGDQGAQLAEGQVARLLVQPAVGADHQPLRREVRECEPDARGDLLRRLHVRAHHLHDADAELCPLAVEPAAQQLDLRHPGPSGLEVDLVPADGPAGVEELRQAGGVDFGVGAVDPGRHDQGRGDALHVRPRLHGPLRLRVPAGAGAAAGAAAAARTDPPARARGEARTAAPGATSAAALDPGDPRRLTSAPPSPTRPPGTVSPRNGYPLHSAHFGDGCRVATLGRPRGCSSVGRAQQSHC